MEAWARAFSAVKHPVPRAAIHRQIGKGSDLMLGTLLADKALQGRANELHSQFFAEMKGQAYPLPGAKEIIATLSLHHIAIWLATSAKSEELEHHVQALEAKDKLAGLVSSADVDNAKPAPDIFQLTKPARKPLVLHGDEWQPGARRRYRAPSRRFLKKPHPLGGEFHPGAGWMFPAGEHCGR